MSEAHTPARPTIPTEATDMVPVRELEQRLESLQKLFDERTRYEREILSTRENLLKDALEKRLLHEREVMDTREAALKEALTIAAVETRRRLDELNHSHELALENWARSLPRDMFAQWQREYDVWRSEVQVILTKVEPHQGDITAIRARVATIETMANKLTGALLLLGMMGLAGVLALILGLARLAGVLQ